MYILLHDQTETIRVCRLCGLSLEVPYFDILGDSGQFLSFAIQKYLSIEVSDKENYSKTVCHNCNRKIEEWNDYYTKCHEFQTLLKNSMLEESNTLQRKVSHSLENESVSTHLSKLVEEFVQDSSIEEENKIPHVTSVIEEPIDSSGAMPVDSTGVNQNESDSLENEDDHSTEDEFEDELTTSDNESDEHSDNSTEDKQKHKPRHKKFIFTIPFLEKKVNRRFTSAEKAKLQKHISKRQNTLICKQYTNNSYWNCNVNISKFPFIDEMLIGGGPGQQWECQICQKSVKGRACEVTKHYLKTHQVQPIFPCHACDYTSRTEKMYQAHRMSHLVEYPCEHCGKIFSQHSRLVYHMNSHTNEREFECDICQKKFNTAQYVTTHKRKVHGDQEKVFF